MGNRTIVTGASGAMGEAAVRALARDGRSVVMACRNLEKAEAVRSRILADLPGADISIGRLDLSSLDSVRAFADSLGQEQVSALFNNAGVISRGYSLTGDGLENTFAVNYFGPFLLTRLLLPLMGPEASIVNMVSLTCRYVSVTEKSLRPSADEFSQLGTYARSKLALLRFSRELARRNPGLHINLADPGSGRRMIGWFTRHDVEINPRKVPASLFSRDEGFGVDSADKTGSIRFDLLVDESHTLEFEASDHPIENGAVITDHVTQKLRTCTVTGMFTNFPDRNEFGESTDGYTGVQVSDGTPVKDNRARDMFVALENLAMQRKPVRLVTALHVYPEMIITSLPVKFGAEDGESIKFTMTLREFKVAELKKTVAFGKFRPPDMKSAENRTIAPKQTNGKVSAKGKELVDAAISAGGFN